jgi:hypothetical protein
VAYWGGFSPSTLVYPASPHSTKCSAVVSRQRYKVKKKASVGMLLLKQAHFLSDLFRFLFWLQVLEAFPRFVGLFFLCRSVDDAIFSTDIISETYPGLLALKLHPHSY